NCGGGGIAGQELAQHLWRQQDISIEVTLNVDDPDEGLTSGDVGVDEVHDIGDGVGVTSGDIARSGIGGKGSVTGVGIDVNIIINGGSSVDSDFFDGGGVGDSQITDFARVDHDIARDIASYIGREGGGTASTGAY